MLKFRQIVEDIDYNCILINNTILCTFKITSCQIMCYSRVRNDTNYFTAINDWHLLDICFTQQMTDTERTEFKRLLSLAAESSITADD